MNLDEFILAAIREDLGDGDHTSLATIPAGSRGAMKLLVKQAGVIAGVEVARSVFRLIDPAMAIAVYFDDGSEVRPGDVVFHVEGEVIPMLQAERLALNFMQRMSGIATTTRAYVKAVEGFKVKILDTRKTTPNARYFEKEAVRLGGGGNHRMGLYDMILVKDNHVDFAGGIPAAIDRVQAYLAENMKKLPIEVEVRDLEELGQILAHGGVDRIMLDNFSITDLEKAVQRIGGKYETEASGGITLKNIREIAATGVDFISVGALTHQILSLDLSLKAVRK